MDAYEFAFSISEQLETMKRSEFSIFEMTIFIVMAVEVEVNNGGFAQLYFNSAGEFANDAPAAFEEIGAVKTADMIRQANLLFGDAVPVDFEKRQLALESLGDESEEQFERLDNAFFAYPEDISNLLNAYYQSGRNSR